MRYSAGDTAHCDRNEGATTMTMTEPRTDAPTIEWHARQDLLLDIETEANRTRLHTAIILATRTFNRIGNDPHDVAELCRSVGVTGKAQCADVCVIANLFAKLFGVRAVVGGTQATLVVNNTQREMRLPAHVDQFIHNFDNELYPDLIDEDASDGE